MKATQIDIDQCSGKKPPTKWQARRKNARNETNFLPFDKTEIEYSVIKRWKRVVAKFPEHIALQMIKGDSEFRLTYAETDQLSDKIAQSILESKRESQLVALLFDHSVEAVISMIGVLKAGYGYVALDTSLPQAELTERLTDSKAKVIVTPKNLLKLVPQKWASNHSIFIYEEVVERMYLNEFIPTYLSGDSLFCVSYTSGSTGKSKGIIRTHSGVLLSAWLYSNQLHFSKNDRIPLAFNWSYGYGGVILFYTLLSGATCILVEPKKIISFSDWITENQVSFLPIPISLFRNMLTQQIANEEKKFALGKTIEGVVLSGQALLWEEVSNFIQQYGCFNTVFRYVLGSSEGGAISDYFFQHPVGEKNGRIPVGYPLSNKEIQIVDENRQSLPIGSVGEIVIQSPYISKGYWQRPKLTAAKYQLDSNSRNTHFFSGDLGRINEDGILEFLGRKDHMVKVRGYRVELSTIEIALQKIEGVKQAVVTAPELSNGERKIIAYVVSSDAQLNGRILRYTLADQLTEYAIPSQFVFMDTLPLTISGKIDRKALPEPNLTRLIDNLLVPPKTLTESKLITLWERILSLSPIGVTDNIFDLGGNSLTVMQLMALVKQHFGVEIDLSIFFETATVRGLAKLIDSGETAQLMYPQNIPIREQNLPRISNSSVFRHIRKMLFGIIEGTFSPKIILWLVTRKIVRPRNYPQIPKQLILEFLNCIDYPHDRKEAIYRTLKYNSIEPFLNFLARRYENENTTPSFPYPSPKISGFDKVKKSQSKGKGVILIGIHTIHTHYWKYYMRRHFDYFTIQRTKGDSFNETQYNFQFEKTYSTQLNYARHLLEEGKIIQIIADGHAGFSPGLEFDFHGIRRTFLTGFAELALFTKATIIPVIKEIDQHDQTIITFGNPFDFGPSNFDDKQRIHYIVNQYVKLLSTYWSEQPWMIDLRYIKRHLNI